MRVWKATGRKPKELERHGEAPEDLAYLWHWFLELRLPITYTELHHWQALTRRSLKAWEVDLLMTFDRLTRTPND